MSGLLESLASLVGGVFRRWYFWTPPILLDPFDVYAHVKSSLPVDLQMDLTMPSGWGLGALVALFAWAVVLTYHEKHVLARSGTNTGRIYIDFPKNCSIRWENEQSYIDPSAFLTPKIKCSGVDYPSIPMWIVNHSGSNLFNVEIVLKYNCPNIGVTIAESGIFNQIIVELLDDQIKLEVQHSSGSRSATIPLSDTESLNIRKIPLLERNGDDSGYLVLIPDKISKLVLLFAASEGVKAHNVYDNIMYNINKSPQIDKERPDFNNLLKYNISMSSIIHSIDIHDIEIKFSAEDDNGIKIEKQYRHSLVCSSNMAPGILPTANSDELHFMVGDGSLAFLERGDE